MTKLNVKINGGGGGDGGDCGGGGDGGDCGDCGGCDGYAVLHATCGDDGGDGDHAAYVFARGKVRTARERDGAALRILRGGGGGGSGGGSGDGGGGARQTGARDDSCGGGDFYEYGSKTYVFHVWFFCNAFSLCGICGLIQRNEIYDDELNPLYIY